MNTPLTANSNPFWQTIDKTSLMPVEASTRDLAVGLYELVSSLPIISPHGHVDPQMLWENRRFASAADLFIYHNHYVTRLLHADGVDLAMVRAPKGESNSDRSKQHAIEAWKIFAERWHLFAGTASGYWFVRELRSIFGIETEFTPSSAEGIRQEIETKLDLPDFFPRSLFERFNIELLATTDSPLDSLETHTALNSGALPGRIAPTLALTLL